MAVEIMFIGTTQCLLTVYLRNNPILKWHIGVFLDLTASRRSSIVCVMSALPLLFLIFFLYLQVCEGV